MFKKKRVIALARKQMFTDVQDNVKACLPSCSVDEGQVTRFLQMFGLVVMDVDAHVKAEPDV